MKKRKILILLILFVAVAGIAMGSASAKTYTKTVKFKDSTTSPVNTYIGKGDSISTFYNSKFSPQFNKNRAMVIVIANVKNFEAAPHYKLINAKIKFTKKVKGKIKTATKTYKPNKSGTINYQAPQGWKPSSAVVKFQTNNNIF